MPNRPESSAAPLIAEARRREHEGAVERRARAEFGQHEARLYRLAQADRVGEEQPARAVANDRQGGFELVRKQIERRAGGRRQRSRRALAEQGDAQRGHPGTPRGRHDQVRLRAARQTVERREQDNRTPGRGRVAGRRLEVEFLAVGVGHHRAQQPRASARLHERSRFNGRVQELPPPGAWRVAENATLAARPSGYPPCSGRRPRDGGFLRKGRAILPAVAERPAGRLRRDRLGLGTRARDARLRTTATSRTRFAMNRTNCLRWAWLSC